MPGVVAAPALSVMIEIGATPIRLLADATPVITLAQDRYAGFLRADHTAGCPPLELTVDVLPRINSADPDIRVTRQGRRWFAHRADFNLNWDSQTNSGHLQLALNAYSLDAALRILHTLILAQEGGFLLHAASAVRNGRASFFFGPSGSGKTTIARLAPPDATLLTDEISYLRREQDNYFAYGTPFTGELAKPGENVSAPIAAFYHLAKGSGNRVISMKPADAAAALLESVLFFAQDSHLVQRLFQSVCDLVSRTPVYLLEFVPNRSVWDLIQ
jgi:hypothetical protein